MARNEEEEQSMLNRFIALKAAEEKKERKEQLPFLLGIKCRDQSHHEELHQLLMREIGRRVVEIQNEGLGEHRLRDLNREINTLLYQKSVWEKIDLKYPRHSGKMIDLDGNIVDLPNPRVRIHGDGYFGAAAMKLPEARRHLEKSPELRKRRTCYRDEEDGVLEREEGPAVKQMRREAEQMRREAEQMRREAEQMRHEAEQMRREAAEEKKMRREAEELRRAAEEMRGEAEEMRREAEEMRREAAEEKKMWREAEEMRRLRKINKAVLEMKKMELVGEGLLEEQSEAKDMLNIQR